MHSRHCAPWRRAIDLDGFRDSFSGMVVRPGPPDCLRLVGEFSFKARWKGTEIEDVYEMEIVVPHSFPRDLPRAFERGGQVPSTCHTNTSGGTLCLGSPLRLQRDLAAQPTLVGYADKGLVPYLFAHSFKQRTGKLPWPDLEHGEAGLLQGYLRLFKTQRTNDVLACLALLAVRRRVANKRPCPCRSGRRLGRCHARILNPFRRIWSRRQFRAERERIGTYIDRRSAPSTRSWSM